MDIAQIITQDAPDYCGLQSVQAALNIQYQRETMYKESTICAWYTTMAKHVFSGDGFGISPKEDILGVQSKYISPVIKKVNNGQLVPWVYFLGKRDNAYAFHICMDEIIRLMSGKLNPNRNPNYFPSVFLVVMRGLDIGFFEFFDTPEKLEGIPNFKGAIPLTQDIPGITNGRSILNNIPNDVRVLHATGPGQGVGAGPVQVPNTITVPCIFNVRTHQREINFLFHHMAIREPRM